VNGLPTIESSVARQMQHFQLFGCEWDGHEITIQTRLGHFVSSTLRSLQANGTTDLARGVSGVGDFKLTDRLTSALLDTCHGERSCRG
jgi:hypothetical protein